MTENTSSLSTTPTSVVDLGSLPVQDFIDVKMPSVLYAFNHLFHVNLSNREELVNLVVSELQTNDITYIKHLTFIFDLGCVFFKVENGTRSMDVNMALLATARYLQEHITELIKGDTSSEERYQKVYEVHTSQTRTHADIVRARHAKVQDVMSQFQQQEQQQSDP